MPYDWSVTAQPTTVDDTGDPDYPVQVYNDVTTAIGTFSVTVGESTLPKGYIVIQGANPDDNVQGINSALSGVSGTKTPLVGYWIAYYDDEGNEVAPFSDLYIQVFFTSNLISSHNSYRLVFKDYGGSYTAVSASGIVEANNEDLVYFEDEVGTIFLVGID